jgi:hypothetical protein
MQKYLKTLIHDNPTKTVKIAELETMLRLKHPGSYQEAGYAGFAAVLEQLCQEHIITPVISSGKNGRNPALYNSYRRVEEKLEQTVLEQLLTFHPDLSLDYYRARPAGYKADLPYLAALNSFLFSPDSAALSIPCSLNERSFQIFRDEKFLGSAVGRTFLQHVGLNLDKLACYQTFEPFFYAQYLRPKDDFANLLIIENKDTFFSLKKCLSEQRRSVAGIPFNFLVYGEGRKIVTSFAFYREVQGLQGQLPIEVGLQQPIIKAYYFGDLDPEGIDIYGQLQENFPEVEIKPFTYLYLQLLQHYPERPKAREKDQKLKSERLDRFLSFFLPPDVEEIKSLLAEKLYLPQEGLNYAYFAREVK